MAKAMIQAASDQNAKDGYSTPILPHVGNQAELIRICSLPIIPDLTPEQVEEMSRRFILAPAYKAGIRLKPKQAEGLAHYIFFGGVLGPIPVGYGKTLLALLICNYAFANEQMRKVMLVLPPNLVPQLLESQLPLARKWIAIQARVFSIAGKSKDERHAILNMDQAGLYVVPYSLLSTEDGREILAKIDPGVIVCDEAHKLRNYRDAAGPKRFMDMLRARKRAGKETKLVFLSGTLTSKSVKDYHHLAREALGRHSPLPALASQADIWASMIDSSGDDTHLDQLPPREIAEIKPLVEWATKNFPADGHRFTFTVGGLRSAYHKRFSTCPGVVTAPGVTVGTSLIIANTPAPPMSLPLLDLIKKVYSGTTPDGDNIDHAIHEYGWLSQLTNGFYYRHVWPSPDEYAARRGISSSEAAELIDKAQRHHEALQIYSSMLRKFLKNSNRAGLDTPYLVGLDMSRHGSAHVPEEMYAQWKFAKDLEFEGMPERDQYFIPVDPFKLDHCMLAAQKINKQRSHPGVIVWYYHRQFGEWMHYRAVNELGITNVEFLPAGPASDRILASERDRIKDKILIASITGHGEGKDLQFLRNQIIAQWPRPAKTAEQLLGRLHREGQEADELVVHTTLSHDFEHQSLAATLNDTVYAQTTTGNEYRLLSATYSPVPEIFPSDVLQTLGFENKILTPEQQSLIDARFTK